MKKRIFALLTALIAALMVAAAAFAMAGFKGGYVCHKGDQTLYFGPNQYKAYKAHLNHGDRKGVCKVHSRGEPGKPGKASAQGGQPGQPGKPGKAGKGGGQPGQAGKPGKAGKPGRASAQGGQAGKVRVEPRREHRWL